MEKSNTPIVDFHAHILPFVDHGSASVEMSAKLLTQAEKAGVAMIVATPHFYAHKHSVDRFLQKRDAGYLALSSYYESQGIATMPIIKGAEVALEHRLVSIPELRRLAIEGTDYILIEMPMTDQWQGWMYDLLYEIEAKHHLHVIIAHVDRYPIKNTAKLLDMGFAAQINASGLVKGLHKRKLHSFCTDGLVQMIGSDAHDDKKRNYGDMIRAKKSISKEMMSFFYTNSLEILGK